MPASDWLSADQIAALEADYGSSAGALLMLLARPDVGDELYALGVQDLSSFGGPDVYVPPERERLVWEIVQTQLLGATRTRISERRGPGRRGTDYVGAGVEDVVRRAHAAQMDDDYLGRTLRDRIASDAKVTPYEVDLIFELITDGKLADGGQKGWLTINGHLSPTPAYINLHELKTAS